MSQFKAPLPLAFLFTGRKYIFLTLIVGLFLNIVPWGRSAGVPDFAGIILLFWNIYEPRIVGLIWSFVFGLFVDVQGGSALGQNAFVYTLQAYIAISLHHRITWLGAGLQIVHVSAILFLSQIFELVINLILGNSLESGWFFMSSVVGALLWPFFVRILIWPRRHLSR